VVSEQQNVPPSCAGLAAQLIVEGCLPIIQGTVKGKAPIQPVPLTKEERDKLGLKEQGITVFYPAGGEGVFFDAGKSSFTVWFNGEDCERATATLHDALMRAFPNAKQLDDVAHKQDSRMRARVYRVDLGQGRLAAIETSFGQAAPGKHKFMARVIAQVRKT
jgi:hypothetical protein